MAQGPSLMMAKQDTPAARVSVWENINLGRFCTKDAAAISLVVRSSKLRAKRCILLRLGVIACKHVKDRWWYIGDGYREEVDQSEIRQENDKWQGWVRRRLDGPWRPWLWPWSDPKMMRFPEISSNVPRALLLYTTIHWIEPSKTHPFYPTMPQIHLIITYRKDLFSIWWRTLEKGPILFEQFTLQRVLFLKTAMGCMLL